MLSLKERVWSRALIDEHDEQKVLNFIAQKTGVMLEEVVAQFPWMRWGDLFLILGRLRREGLLTIHQKASKLEVRITTRRSFGTV